METQNFDLNSLRIDRSFKQDPNSNLKKILKFAVVIAGVILGLFLVVFLYNQFLAPVPEVKLITVASQSQQQTNTTLTASGYVVAQRKAAIASKATGRLIYLGVVEGDKVLKGQVIARIEDSDILAILNEAKANLKFYEADFKEAENNFKRQQKLVSEGASTPFELERAEAVYLKTLAAIEMAKASVKTAEVNLENTVIRAPFNGTVLTKNADIGEVVAPFAASASSRGAVVTIADMNSLQVETDVSESSIEKILPGQPCLIVLDAYSDQSYSGFVDKIVPTADRSKATVMVKVGFKSYDSRVLPEMSAKVSFLSEEVKIDNSAKPLLLVPSSSIRVQDGKSFIYSVKDSYVVEIEVQTGSKLNDFVEIVSGIKDGDKIIGSIRDEIVPGLKVKTN